MFCEAYQRKLKDSAASGEELTDELARHLELCAACGSQWRRELALFAAIDAELQGAVNAETPPSLVAGVRQRIASDERPMAWWKPLLALGAALLVAGGMAVKVAWRDSGRSRIVDESRPANVALNSAPARLADQPSPIWSTARKHPARAVAEHLPVKNSVAAKHQPEVPEILVSPAEVAGLEQYVQRLSTRIPAEVREVKIGAELDIKKLEIAEIDFGAVTIRPLDGDS